MNKTCNSKHSPTNINSVSKLCNLLFIFRQVAGNAIMDAITKQALNVTNKSLNRYAKAEMFAQQGF